MATDLQDEMPSREHNPKNLWACLLERGELLLVAGGACVFFLQLHSVVECMRIRDGVNSHAEEGRQARKSLLVNSPPLYDLITLMCF